jgi:hypothetical protein
MSRAWVLAKKLFSLTLVFNALLSIACIVGVLAGFYWFYHNWQPFAPYLVNGNILWLVIAAAVINIFPSAALGRTLHTGRFLFHHYIYGFIVLFASAAYIMFFTPASLLTIFFVNNTSIAVNIGRFFLLGGFTLLLDDLPDVNGHVESALNWLKLKAHKAGKAILAAQLLTGAVSLYVAVAISLYISQNQQWFSAANLMMISTVFLTSVSSFVFVKRKVWLKLSFNNQGSNHKSR